MGEAGITKALEILHEELDLTVAFTGHTHINAVNHGILVLASPKETPYFWDRVRR